jgi:YesN/AraC family two-component response regulator
MNTIESDPPLRILLVDDHAVEREGLKRVLDGTAAGWAVAEAEGGFEALELARAQPFGVAVVDLSMPGMNGLDSLRRAREQLPHLRVLVLSMHAEHGYAMRAFKAAGPG